MRTLVTGATGFLGLNLCKELQKRGAFIVALRRDIFSCVNVSYWDVLAQGDVSSIANIERILSDYRVDTVFHLAAQTEISVGVSDPIETFESNVRGTWNVLEACRQQKTKRIIVASSDKAYGRTKPPYHEYDPLTPDRPYETSKACVDLIAKTYADTYGMSIAVTRCVNLYGPGCRTISTLVPNTIRRVLRGEAPIIRNGGKMRRDWLYVDDAVDAYIKLADSDYVGAMNFGGGVAVEVKDVVHLILSLMESKLEPIDEVDMHGEIVDQWADTSLAKKILNWQPQTTLQDGLRKTVASFLEPS